jgi:hypothetical protein
MYWCQFFPLLSFPFYLEEPANLDDFKPPPKM